MKVYVKARKLTLRAKNAIGKGGEADVYKLDSKLALKLFKTPDHPDFRPFPDQAQAATVRLDELQAKLRSFPDLGRPEIVGPVDLVTDRQGGRIVGYTMSLVPDAIPIARFSQPRHRRDVDAATVTSAFRQLHDLVSSLHRRGVVIGDFNDLDVLVTEGPQVWLIDVDSYQLPAPPGGGLAFPCRVFSERFLDPTLCDETTGLVPVHAFSPDSDWYAFSLMLFASFLLTDAYGGIHKSPTGSSRAGKNPAARKVLPSQRRFRRITVLHREVKYPKPARPPEILPDEWLDHFDRLLHQDQRGEFPRQLLESVTWTTCHDCDLEHARRACPRCQTRLAMTPLPQVVQGRVRRTLVFECSEGRLLHVALSGGRPRWLMLIGHLIRRDDGRDLPPAAGASLRPWRPVSAGLLGDTAIVVEPDRLCVATGAGIDYLNVDQVEGEPAWAVNGRHLFRVDSGRLVREEALGPCLVGEVLPHQTRFWVGETFGFGYYRAGRLSVAFVFEADGVGLNDQVELPPIGGSWIDVSCCFAMDSCWLSVTAIDSGHTLCHLVAISRDGAVKATRRIDHEVAEGAHQACAVGTCLLVPTDRGIVRLGLAGGRIVETASFPDTKPFVDSACRLLADTGGLYVVSDRAIARLEIAP